MTRFARPLALAAALSLTAFVAACDRGGTRPSGVEPDGAVAPVRAEGAWCRPSPNAARASACYLSLTAPQEDRLVAVSSPAAATVEIHDMVTEGGVMRMSELEDGLPLPADNTQTLAPGGLHLMLMGLVEPLVAGERVSLTLRFENAPEQTIEAEVRQPPAAGGH